MTPSTEPGPAVAAEPGPILAAAAGLEARPPAPRRVVVWVGAALAAAVAAVYAQTLWFGFVPYDDHQYVYQNPQVVQGLTAEGVYWAFTRTHQSNWHPLTSLSHQADCAVYGLRAGGHHLTSVLLHAATAAALFLALRRLTGDLWPGAFVAAAFALHPLRVESVAWVSERKDVLSGLFFALTLLAYERYARRPSLGRYVLVALALGLGLLAKAMLVTVPCVLLLLDYWPLRRFAPPAAAGGSGARAARLVAEKVPLLGLVALAAVATVSAQSTGGTVADLDQFSLGVRAANAVVSYAIYLGQTAYPAGLSAFYPHPRNALAVWQIAGAGALLLGATAAAAALRRRRPALLVGWLWYLGMLVPVIGLVQVGSQGHADRYTYLPQIGLLIALTWGVPWERVLTRSAAACLAIGVLLVLAGVSARQVGVWRNGVALFSHAAAHTPPNQTTFSGLALAHFEQEQYAEAVKWFRRTLELGPDPEASYFLAVSLTRRGDDAGAIEQFHRAYESDPRRTEALTNLAAAHAREGIKRAREGRASQALRHFDAALALQPDNASVRRNKANLYLQIGVAAAQNGQPRTALPAFQEAVRTDPEFGLAHVNLGLALLEVGEAQEAAAEFRAALRIDPNDARARALLVRALGPKRP